MVERFLFDRVNAETGAAAVSREDHLAADVFAHETKAAITGPENASPRTKVAMDAAWFFCGVPPATGLLKTSRGIRWWRQMNGAHGENELYKSVALPSGAKDSFYRAALASLNHNQAGY